MKIGGQELVGFGTQWRLYDGAPIDLFDGAAVEIEFHRARRGDCRVDWLLQYAAF